MEWNGKRRFSRLDWLYRERVCWRDTGEREYIHVFMAQWVSFQVLEFSGGPHDG